MQHRNVRALVLGAVCAALPAAPALSQSAFAKALPADTTMYVSFPDIRTSIEQMKDMPVGKIWREPDVQDFFADALKMAQEHWDQAMEQARAAHEQGQLPFDPDELVKARVHSASFAITKLALDVHDGPDSPLPRIGMLAHLDFGDSAPIWHKVIQTGLQMLAAEAGDDVARSERDVGGTKVVSLRPTEAPDALEMSLEIAFVGNGVIVGTLAADVDTVLGNLQSGEAGLTASTAWQTAAGQLDLQGAEAEFFFRPGAALDFVIDVLEIAKAEGELPPMVKVDGIERALHALGLRGIQGIASTSRYESGKSVSETFVAAPADQRRGLLTSAGAPIGRSFLKWIPKDAVSFSAFRFDLSKIYSTLVGAVRAYDEQMAEHLLGQLAQAEDQLGISLEKDLFGAFGDEFVSWQMPMAAVSAAPEMAVLLKVNDQERLLKTLDTFAQLSDGKFSIDKVERRGITVHQVRLDIDFGSEMGAMNPLQMFVPTFGFKDGYMVLAFSTGDVKRAFTRMEREDDPTEDIRSSEEFAPHLAKIPEDATSISFTDWKTTFESWYQIGTGLLAFVPMDEEIPFDLVLLPDSQTMTQHLFGAVSWSRTTEAGFEATSISPFGPELIVPLAVLIGGGVVAGLSYGGMRVR